MSFAQLIQDIAPQLWQDVTRLPNADNDEHAANVMTEISGFDWRDLYDIELAEGASNAYCFPRYNTAPIVQTIGRREMTNHSDNLPGNAGSKERIEYLRQLVASGNCGELDDLSLFDIVPIKAIASFDTLC